MEITCRESEFFDEESGLWAEKFGKKAHQAIWSAGEVVAAVLLAGVGPCPSTQNYLLLSTDGII